ncbi:TonB-dependent receptor [Pedobacter insulae]|uniref:Outer membrane receptor proteins, mostly Fe transport n=1 Tax=Pedobacter insulae TaxID=414048 RepID=A0A1I2UST7_9SPHI|nr:TonB-dependent receptor [Pedobacter insulae]SFG78847.1 Outer membrane receptor proteins, mostly Fe transport [Pedobacter insulae]
MKKQYIVTLLFFLIGVPSLFAQKQIKGKVKDAKGAPIVSANINLKDKEGSILSFTRTNAKGEFTLSFTEDTKDITLEATIIGFAKKIVSVTELNKTYDLTLEEEQINLKTVVVKNRPSLAVNGDTLSYKTSDFADKQDRSIGDVLKKMPGIEVAENGKITYNGKGISALYQDGDNLLDDKYSIGTKAIPHAAVDKVQVIENDQPIKMLRKNNMSDDVAINLVIKDEAKLKVMGDIKAGLGTPSRFDSEANAMLFKKKIKFINNIKGNNIGIDPGNDLTSFNMSDYMRRIDNDKPGSFLSAGAAGVPTLPQNRSLFNKAGLTNLNNLFKLNKDLQIRANVSYLYDKRNQEYNKFSETYLPEQTIRYTELQENIINPQKFQSKININSNAEMYYLNNNFIVDYAPNKINSNVVINGTGAGQSLSQKTFDISNEFNYRKRLKSENTINLYSYLNRSTQPEVLNIRPGLNEDILNNGTPFAGLDQYVKLPSWYTNNYMSFGLVNGKFTQSYRTGFNLQHQQLNSELYRIQNNQTTELISSEMTNNLEWLKGKVYIDGSYEYSGEKLKTSLSLPLSYQSISYNDPSKGVDKKLNKVFLNPSFSAKYQTSPENYVSANYSFRNELGGLDDVYTGTILKNYRSLFANNAPISERKTHGMGAAFNFRRAMQMFFFNAGINYSNTTLNTISSFTLSNNIQQRVVLPLENHVKSLSGQANASKYLFSLRSTINAGFSYTNSQFDQLQNNRLLPFDSKTMAYKAGIDSKITNFMTWSYTANYSVTANRLVNANAVKTNYQQIRQQSNLTFTAFKSVFMKISAEHMYTKQSSQSDLSYLFADFNMRYKFTKLKTDLEFGVTNLANIKKFEAINISANALTNGTYYIPGRVAMLKATFNY